MWPFKKVIKIPIPQCSSEDEKERARDEWWEKRKILDAYNEWKALPDYFLLERCKKCGHNNFIQKYVQSPAKVYYGRCTGIWFSYVDFKCTCCGWSYVTKTKDGEMMVTIPKDSPYSCMLEEQQEKILKIIKEGWEGIKEAE